MTQLKMTKTDRILEWMRYRPITNAIAVEKFNEYRLSDVILRLRKAGHIIDCEMVKKKDGTGKYGVYRLIKERR